LGLRRVPRIHRLLAWRGHGPDHRRAAPARGCRGVRLPGPRALPRPVDRRGPGGPGPARGRGVGPGARLPQGRHRRLLHGRLGRGPARRSVRLLCPRRRPRRGGFGQRPRLVVRTVDGADALDPLARAAPGRASRERRGVPHADREGRLEARPGVPRGGRAPDRAGAAAGGARRRRPVLPGRARPGAVPGRPGTAAAVDREGVRARRGRDGHRPGGADRALGAGAGRGGPGGRGSGRGRFGNRGGRGGVPAGDDGSGRTTPEEGAPA
jgi:translation initiation factor IF-2